jgi:DNA repair protein RadC
MKIREAQISYTETEHEFQACELTNATRVVDYMRGAIDFRPDQEQVWVLLLDARLQPLGRFLCALGTVSSVTVHPREVFKPAILASASSIIFVHNHPSGNPEPSDADNKVTRQLSRAGEILGISLVDHLVLGETYYSYSESNSEYLSGA